MTCTQLPSDFRSGLCCWYNPTCALVLPELSPIFFGHQSRLWSAGESSSADCSIAVWCC